MAPLWHVFGLLQRRLRAGRSAVQASYLSACLGVTLACAFVAADSQVPLERIPLFDPEVFPAGWVHFSAGEGSRLADTWRIERSQTDGHVLVCTGQPYGYIRTAEAYHNFEFGLEWKYPTAENGNSGVLVHTNGGDKIWPTAIQIQLHTPSAGSILPTGGASPKTPVRARDLSRGVNEWNSCVISCRDGRLSVTINGTPSGEIEGCLPYKGMIALQSEGSEIHFRNIWLRRLGDSGAKTE